MKGSKKKGLWRWINILSSCSCMCGDEEEFIFLLQSSPGGNTGNTRMRTIEEEEYNAADSSAREPSTTGNEMFEQDSITTICEEEEDIVKVDSNTHHEGLRSSNYLEITKRIFAFNSMSPFEQPWLAFALSLLLGAFAKSSNMHEDENGYVISATFCYVFVLPLLWLLQERIAVSFMDVDDPLVQQYHRYRILKRVRESISTDSTEDSFENASQSNASAGELTSHSEATVTPPVLKQDDFWSFSSCITTPLDDHTFTAEQEAAINSISSKYFDPNSELFKRESKYLCVNEDGRWGAIRALQARRFNVVEAEKVIEKTLEWRRSEQINDVFVNRPLSDDYIHKMRLALGDGFWALDKTGHPIWWCPAGSVHLNNLKEEVPLENLLWLHVIMVEFNQRIWFRALSQTQPRPVYQLTIVLNLTGFGISNVRGGFYECFNRIGDVDRDFYYENVYRVYIINAPSFFRFFWRTLSPLFDPDTRVKFQVLSSPKDLHEFIDVDMIPKEFGGRCTRSDLTYGQRENTATVYTQHLDEFLSMYRAGQITDDTEYVRNVLRGQAPKVDEAVGKGSI